MTRKAPGPLAAPTPLPVDGRVAVVAYAYPSGSEPETTHHTALMVQSSTDAICPRLALTGTHFLQHETTEHPGSGRYVCKHCRLVVLAWECSCGDSTFRDRICKHIRDARERLAERERINSRRAPG